MIKTKLFSGYFTGEYGTSERMFIDIDTEMNEFLTETGVELIDVKFALSVDTDGQPWNNALMIYKEKQD